MTTVGRVREFNRAYTRVIGVLQAGLVGTPHTLTDAGERAFAELDSAKDAAVAEMLTPLALEQRARLVEAMAVIQDVLGESERPRGYVLRAPEPGDLGWVVARHGALYAREYGWDTTFEALVARTTPTTTTQPGTRPGSPRSTAPRRARCSACTATTPDTAHLRILLVEPSARGLGIGACLVEECLRFARRSGYSRMTLWTNDVLEDARRIYERAGFGLESEAPHRAFGHDLVGQFWSREL